jgi:hypothetical protein
MDGTLINGNAAKDSVKRGPVVLMEQLRAVYQKQEQKLDEVQEQKQDEVKDNSPKVGEKPGLEAAETEPSEDGVGLHMVSRRRLVGRKPAASKETRFSTTDMDTAVVRKGQGDGARPRYKNHRVVDDRFGVITGTETTAGDVAENAKLMDLVQQHEENTAQAVETVVADAQYGTNENFAACHERGIRSHMADLKQTYINDASAAVFGEDTFLYNEEKDIYICPAGETLKRLREDRGFQVYGITGKTCQACALRAQCTRSKTGRTVKRHQHHQRIQAAREQSHSRAARQDRKRRRYLMEGSFADGANNHGLKRARWRGLANQQTQDYLIASCQNIRTLIRFGRTPAPIKAMQMTVPATTTEVVVMICTKLMLPFDIETSMFANPAPRENQNSLSW